MYLKFEDAYSEYFKYVCDRQKVQSVGTLKQRFETKILPFFKDYNIYDIKEIDYINWQHDINKFDYSNNYKRNLHYLMSGFFEYLILFFNVDFNIPKRVGNFKMKNVKIEHDFYTLKEFKLFIKYVDDEVYKQFFTFMFYVGTRPGEAMALRFSDLSYCNVSINKTISEHSFNGSRSIDDPKSISSFRDLNIDKKLYKSLLNLKDYYISLYGDSDYDYYVFGGIKPLAPTTINRHKKNACLKSGVKSIKLHEFRHSHASLLHSLNVPLQQIKERLGHSNINVTMSVYVHLTDKHKKRITRILNLLRLKY